MANPCCRPNRLMLWLQTKPRHCAALDITPRPGPWSWRPKPETHPMNTTPVAIAAIIAAAYVVTVCRAGRRDVPRVAKAFARSLATVAVALLPTE
ncbi:hypothetical protein [Streptomyces drozdowiczii]|uniref:hypothetical protein n=1 Tax=Streptomyces drozdowiczii TaxID=202862 RepID=UPI00403C166E